MVNRKVNNLRIFKELINILYFYDENNQTSTEKFKVEIKNK